MSPNEAIGALKLINLKGVHPFYDWEEMLEVRNVAIKALENQIPKKPYKRKEHKQNDYYCAICKCYLGDEMELQNACLQPKYCEHCGQKLLWESDTK